MTSRLSPCLCGFNATVAINLYLYFFSDQCCNEKDDIIFGFNVTINSNTKVKCILENSNLKKIQ